MFGKNVLKSVDVLQRKNYNGGLIKYFIVLPLCQQEQTFDG
jgi:hypothetical protein